MNPNRAVFLDRDGTLNVDPGYLSDPDQVVLLPGVGEALARLGNAGFLLVVVSNQSGIGRGIFPEAALGPIHQRMNDLLRPFGARIDAFRYCPHRPEDACSCRKPSPALLLDAARDLGIDLSRSFMVGDKAIDLEAGRAAGCAAGLVRTGAGREEERCLGPGAADWVGDSLGDAVSWILSG